MVLLKYLVTITKSIIIVKTHLDFHFFLSELKKKN